MVVAEEYCQVFDLRRRLGGEQVRRLAESLLLIPSPLCDSYRRHGIHGYGVEYTSSAVVTISCTQLRSGMKKVAEQNDSAIDLIESNLEKDQHRLEHRLR